MSIKIDDNRTNMDNLIAGLAEISSKSVEVGVLDNADEKTKIIAGANEFGAEIKSKKAMKYFWYLMGQYHEAVGDKKYKEISGKTGKGYIVIPERSYLRSTFDDVAVQNKIVETMRLYLNQALTGKNTFGEVLTRAGNVLRLAIQSRIRTDIKPANHPLTAFLKGHESTLKGKTNKLIDSIKSRVI